MGNSVLCYDVQMWGMDSEQEQRKEIDSLDFQVLEDIHISHSLDSQEDQTFKANAHWKQGP